MSQPQDALKSNLPVIMIRSWEVGGLRNPQTVFRELLNRSFRIWVLLPRRFEKYLNSDATVSQLVMWEPCPLCAQGWIGCLDLILDRLGMGEDFLTREVSCAKQVSDLLLLVPLSQLPPDISYFIRGSSFFPCDNCYWFECEKRGNKSIK